MKMTVNVGTEKKLNWRVKGFTQILLKQYNKKWNKNTRSIQAGMAITVSSDFITVFKIYDVHYFN